MSTEALRTNEPATTGHGDAGPDPAEVGQVMGQLMADLAATSGMLLTLVGVRIGLWESLAAGPASPGELAARSSASEPYVREWLRSQAAAGYVRYESPAGRYSLPPAVAAVMAADPLRGLVERTGLQAAAQWAEVARYEDAFRTGSGIGWDEHGPAHSRGMDLISRAVVVPALTGWLAALGGVAARQRASGITQRDLALAVDISEQQMSEILNGKIRRLPPWARVRANGGSLPGPGIGGCA